jgi:hypothetical protein
MKLSLKKKTVIIDIHEGFVDPKELEPGSEIPDVVFKVKVELPGKDTIQNKLMECKKKSLVYGTNPETGKMESVVHEEFDYVKYVTSRCVSEIKEFIDGPVDDDDNVVEANKDNITLLCRLHTPIMTHIINMIDKVAGLTEEEMGVAAKN